LLYYNPKEAEKKDSLALSCGLLKPPEMLKYKENYGDKKIPKK
jgi:hypothetical protein